MKPRNWFIRRLHDQESKLAIDRKLAANVAASRPCFDLTNSFFPVAKVQYMLQKPNLLVVSSSLAWARIAVASCPLMYVLSCRAHTQHSFKPVLKLLCMFLLCCSVALAPECTITSTFRPGSWPW